MWSVSAAGAEAFAGKVTLVSSGHIIQVEHDGKRDLVVLDGVKSPDSKTPAGKQAKAFVANRVLGQEVKVEVSKRLDRIVNGTVFLADGTDLGQLVLSEGMGSWNRIAAPDNTRYRDLEAGARMQNLGLWGLEDSTSAVSAVVALPAKPARRVEMGPADNSNTAGEAPADGKRPKLVLRGDADVAEAAHAAFEKEQAAAAAEQARQMAEQQRLIEQEQKRIEEEQKKEEEAMQKEEEAMAQDGALDIGAMPVP